MTRTELKELIKEVIRTARKEKLNETSNSNNANGITAKGVTVKSASPTVAAQPNVSMGGLKAAKGGSTGTGGEAAPYDFNKYLRDNERIKGRMLKI